VTATTSGDAAVVRYRNRHGLAPTSSCRRGASGSARGVGGTAGPAGRGRTRPAANREHTHDEHEHRATDLDACDFVCTTETVRNRCGAAYASHQYETGESICDDSLREET
jgi:hypothetical protein